MSLEKSLKEEIQDYECKAKCNESGHNRTIQSICKENECGKPLCMTCVKTH